MKHIMSTIYGIIALGAIMIMLSPMETYAQGRTDKNITAGIEKSPGYYEENVRKLFKNGQWAAGKQLLDEGYKYYPYLSALNELMGQYYYQYKQYDKARFYLINSLKDDESNHQSREILVKVEEETKNYSSAIVYVNELLEVSPYSEHWWRKKIALYRYLGNDDEADRLLERLRSIYPESERIKKDWNYRLEVKYRNEHNKGDITAQIQTLRQLIELNPRNVEYYLALTNYLLQAGHDAEAADVAGEGASFSPHSKELIQKKVGILVGLNRYSEAMAYLDSFKGTSMAGYAAQLRKDIQLDAARAAQLNDPYIQYAKAYDTNHSDEALTFLLNTSMSRGYYDDALVYLNEAKKRYGENPSLLYKEYLVNRRLGNTSRANGLLNRLYEMTPENDEVATELARINLDKAQEFMRYEQYSDAIPLLKMASSDYVETELRQAAMLRLFNCYLMTKDYDNALALLDSYNNKFGYNAYLQQKARIYSEQGKTSVALELLKDGYTNAPDSMKAAYAGAYEEIVLPYIKSLIATGTLYIADNQIKEAIKICPNSNDLLRMGITTTQLLRKNDLTAEYVRIGRQQFPDDPFFIVKEAQTYQASGNYRNAIDMVRPLVDTYIGDSTVIGTYAENSQLLALQYIKEKKLQEAMEVVDSALLIWPTHNELLYTKGLVYKAQKDWANAYTYLKMYKPSAAELKAHQRLLNDMLNRGYKNVVSFEYQQARLGNTDEITGNAYMGYTRREEWNEYTFDLSYLGRDGVEASEGVTDLTEGGTGVMLGAQWKHMFTKKFNAYIKGAWANKYFPKFTIKAGAALDIPHNWTINVDYSLRHVQSYAGVYGWTDPDGSLGIENVYVRTGWSKSYKNLHMLTLGLTKTLDQFIIAGSVDGFLLDSKYYINGKAKIQFFPFEGVNSHIFATGGVGTAPESSIIDRSLPAAFDHLNTFVGFGGYYTVNQHLGFSVSGTWYTMYTQSEELLTGVYENDPLVATSYNNIFYVNASALISF